MLVSVLIPNFNYGRFLKRCIDSVLGQTYTNIEIIVYDDGSTDISREVLNGYGNRIVTILAANYGAGHAANQIHAINQAFSQSRGEIICLLDSDDAFEPEKIEHVVECFSANPSVVAVENFGHYVTEDDQILRPYNRHLLPFSSREGVLTQDDLLSKIRTSRFPFMGLPTSFLSFRRDFLSAHMPLDERGFNACFVDLRLSCQVPTGGDYYISRRALSRYRIHGSNNFYGRPANTFIRCMIQSCVFSNNILKQHTGQGVFFWVSRPMLRFYRIYLRKLRSQLKRRMRS